MDDRDVEMLRLANARYRFEGARAVDVRERFGLSLTQMWQRINALIDDPDACRSEPMLTSRLRRIRDARAGQKKAS